MHVLIEKLPDCFSQNNNEEISQAEHIDLIQCIKDGLHENAKSRDWCFSWGSQAEKRSCILKAAEQRMEKLRAEEAPDFYEYYKEMFEKKRKKMFSEPGLIVINLYHIMLMDDAMIRTCLLKHGGTSCC